MTKFTKKIPEFVWMINNSEWKQGPYVNDPQKRSKNLGNVRKFKLIEVNENVEVFDGKLDNVYDIMKKFVNNEIVDSDYTTPGNDP